MYPVLAPNHHAFIERAAYFVGNGYVYYVAGTLQANLDPVEFVESLVPKYEINISKYKRTRRKKAGLCNVQLVMCALPSGGHFFAMFATKGQGRWWRRERGIEDVRNKGLRFGLGDMHYVVTRKYSTITTKSHTSVRIHPDSYRKLRDHYVDICTNNAVRGAATMERELAGIDHLFQPWAGIKEQLSAIVTQVNSKRKRAGLEQVSPECLPSTRRRYYMREWPALVREEIEGGLPERRNREVRLRITPSEYERLGRLAEQTGTHVNAFAADVLAMYLDAAADEQAQQAA